MDELIIKNLIKEALLGRINSYSPYSNFKVGAALLCKSGKIYRGCNIENASYTPSICAERTAIFKAISEGEKDFIAIAIAGGESMEKDLLSKYAYPCGVCRQVIGEFVNKKEFLVIVGKSIEDYKVFTFDELMPFTFDL